MRVVYGGIACLFAVLLSASGCTEKEPGPPEKAPVVSGLTLETVASVAVVEQFSVTGTVKAKNAAQVSARIAGAVTGVFVREGDRVRQGAPLLQLDALERSAGAAAAEHGVAEAVARKQLADVTYERFAALYAEQAVTRQELDTRRAERDTAAQALARAREDARAAGALAGYARIIAPVSGIVTARLVDPGSTVFPGMPLLIIEEPGSYRLEVAVPESLQEKITIGAAVPVVLDGLAPGSLGTVVEVEPRVDPLSRTFTVKLAIPAQGVRSGRFGRALLPVGRKQALLVPNTAVRERGQLTFVWVVDGGNSARMRLVKPGGTHGERVEILAGLVAGERVVTGGMERVTDGARVQ
jgi:membrane fusion protein, multidrug efflux system